MANEYQYPLTFNFRQAGGKQKVFFSLKCEEGDVDLVTNATWIHIEKGEVTPTTIDGEPAITGYFVINVYAGSAARSERIHFVVNDGEECDAFDSKYIEIVQDGAPCSCGISNFNPQSLTWANDTTTPLAINYDTKGGCLNVTKATITTNPNNHFTADTATTGVITVTPGTAGEENVEGEITIEYSANGEGCSNAKIPLTHEGSNCGCGSFYFNDSRMLVWANDSDLTAQTKSFTTAGCISEITPTVITNSHFEVSRDGDGIKVRPTASTTTDITETVTVTYSANGVPCTPAKTFNVKHEGNDCSCGILNFNVDGKSVSTGGDIPWDYESYGKDTASKTIKYTVDSTRQACIVGNVEWTIDGEDAEYFGKEDVDSSTVKIWPTQENEEDRNLNAYLRYSYTLTNGTTCDGTFDYLKLVQVKANYCNCNLPDACFRKTVPLYWSSSTGYNSYILGYGYSCIIDDEERGRFWSDSRLPANATFAVRKATGSRNKYEFVLTVQNKATGTNPIRFDFEIHYEKRYGDVIIGDCKKSYTAYQTDDYITCERISADNMKIYDPLFDISSSAGVQSVGRVTNTYGIDTYKILYANSVFVPTKITVPTSAQTWISDFEIHMPETDTSPVNIKARLTANEHADVRTTTATVRFDTSKLDEVYGICNCNPAIEFEIKQKGNSQPGECDCQESTVAFTYSGSSSSGESNDYISYHTYDEECFTGSVRFILADKNKNEIQGSDSTYKQIPPDNWLSAKVEDVTESSGEHRPKVYWKYDKNESTDNRTAILYCVYKLSTGDCYKEIRITQEGKVANCSALNASIKDLSSVSYNAGSNALIAYTSNLLIDGTRLSGVTLSSTADWVNDVHIDNEDPTELRADLKDNVKKTGVTDGARPDRTTTVQAFFVYDDEQHNKVTIGGEECQGKPITITQKGYSGACPSCASMTEANIDVDYEDYGDEKPGGGRWKCSSDAGQVPAFHSGSKDLFKVVLNGITTEYEGNTITCFKLSASTDETTYLSFVSAVPVEGTNNEYIVKGTVADLSESLEAQPVAISLHLMKRDFTSDTEQYIECTSINESGHIVVMPHGKDCDGNPIS